MSPLEPFALGLAAELTRLDDTANSAAAQVGVVAHLRRWMVGNPRRTVGRRGAAILLLLARLGLRAGAVAALGLEDIDRRAGEIIVRGKGNRAERLPLPVEGCRSWNTRPTSDNSRPHTVRSGAADRCDRRAAALGRAGQPRLGRRLA